MHFQFLVILVPDPCLSDPCDVNAICEREGLLSDRFVCTCQPPFTEGTGFNCSGMTCNKIITKTHDFIKIINTDGIIQHNNIIIISVMR